MCNSQISAVHPVSISFCTRGGRAVKRTSLCRTSHQLTCFIAAQTCSQRKPATNERSKLPDCAAQAYGGSTQKAIEPLTVFLWLVRSSMLSTAASQRLVKSIDWKVLRLGPVTPQQLYWKPAGVGGQPSGVDPPVLSIVMMLCFPCSFKKRNIPNVLHEIDVDKNGHVDIIFLSGKDWLHCEQLFPNPG